MKNKKVLIIGAGISGIAARLRLLSEGINVCLLEKSRGTGGRMAVRRGEGWIADTGAQFTNATTKQWHDLVWQNSEDINELQVQQRGQSSTRFIHKKGMSRFVRMVANRCGSMDEILFSHKVTHIWQDESTQDKWNVFTECNKKFSADAVLLTAPIPQSLELLKNSNLTLEQDLFQKLAHIEYTSCLSLIAEIAEPAPMLPSAIWKDPSPEFSGIYDQSGKGIPNSHRIWVCQAAPALSQELWSLSETALISKLTENLKTIIKNNGADLNIKQATLHKWKFSEPKVVMPQKTIALNFTNTHRPHAPLLLAGDGFERPSIEGAFCSGAEAGAQITHLLKF